MKEYLLLRNNNESGPYSLDELKVMGLKAYDLIWIENRSFSWKYPSEINELAVFAPPLPDTPADDTDLSVSISGIKINEETVFVKDDQIINKKASVKQLSHIVALKPSVEHIQIKTIKPTAHPNMVKVEIREQELIPNTAVASSGVNSVYKPESQDHFHSATTILHPVYTTGQTYRKSHLWENLFSLSDNNKMEIVVLAIGTASLLAVAYLLITSGY